MSKDSFRNNIAKMVNTRVLILVGALVSLVGCGKFGLYDSDSSKVIAKVGEIELRESAIEELFNASMKPQDSIEIRQMAINNWIVEQIKQQAAEDALSDDDDNEKKIEKMVAQYRLDLLTHTFEQRYLDRGLDTAVSAKQVAEYYHRNSGNFRLIGPLVKAIVVRLPSELRQSAKLEKMFKNGRDDDMAEFLEICNKNDYKVSDFREDWVEFGSVLEHLPFRSVDYDSFLKSHKNYEVSDDQYKYLLHVDSYLLTGAASPLERESRTITKILRNQRRDSLRRELNDSLVERAYVGGKVMLLGAGDELEIVLDKEE